MHGDLVATCQLVRPGQLVVERHVRFHEALQKRQQGAGLRRVVVRQLDEPRHHLAIHHLADHLLLVAGVAVAGART